MKWHPLITDLKTKEHILNKINSIGSEIEGSPSEYPYLLGYDAGISIFWEYLFSYSKNIRHLEYALKMTNSSLNAISDTPMEYNFSVGVAGILWAYVHLANKSHQNANLDSLIGNDIYQFLLKGSIQDIRQSNYDFLHGGLGVLPFFLEQSENKNCSDAIQKLITELEKASETYIEGTSWFAGWQSLMKKEITYDLGMAHGLPSIIVLLSRVHELNICPETTKKLLEGSVNWLLAQKQSTGEHGLFPSMLPIASPFSSRVAWCYGDLGISIALLQAGFAMDNQNWVEKAILIAKNTAKRKNPEAGAVDACLCHGTAGNAHLFNRLYQYTLVPEFKDTALYWYELTLDFYGKNGHFKAFTNDMDGSNKRYELKYGLLEGLTGIGLSLLAAVSDVEPKWDRCLLLS